jgi:RNA polymerase sigma-B factor
VQAVPGSRSAPANDPARERRLHLRCKDGDVAAKEELVERFMPLAKRLASRYRAGSESPEDLQQVAYLGLLKAIDRYDPHAGPFMRFAVPTILGELKRHFRQTRWSVHVPRSLQERVLDVSGAIEALSGTLGRSPTPADVAEATGLELEEVLEAMDATTANNPIALDAPFGGEEGSEVTLSETVGDRDQGYHLVELGEAVAPAVRALPPRERCILHLRFVEDLTQVEIAERIGISQMHVSRLLRRALDSLQEAAAEAA